jgi:hypothetical protein
MNTNDAGLPIEAIADYLCADSDVAIARANKLIKLAFDFIEAARLDAAGCHTAASSKRDAWYDR